MSRVSVLAPCLARPAAPPASDWRALMAGRAKTFTFAARFLPPAQREATTVLYAFFRTVDDLVDERAPHADPAPIRAELAAWRAWLQGAVSRPAVTDVLLARALAEVLDRYAIPRFYLIQLLDGVEMDLGTIACQTFPQLRRYCYLVAGVVGQAMCSVLGNTSVRAQVAAAALGIAMQLTNILRDVREDVCQNRYYLPETELMSYGLSHRHLDRFAQEGLNSPAEVAAWRDYLHPQIQRAQSYYAVGLDGVWLLPPANRLPILIAGRLYRAILTNIARDPAKVWYCRAATSRVQKGALAAGALAECSVRWLFPSGLGHSA